MDTGLSVFQLPAEASTMVKKYAVLSNLCLEHQQLFQKFLEEASDVSGILAVGVKIGASDQALIICGYFSDLVADNQLQAAFRPFDDALCGASDRLIPVIYFTQVRSKDEMMANAQDESHSFFGSIAQGSQSIGLITPFSAS